MKIIRWLLSHFLFILLIVAVIYAYMFWGNLLGEETPAGKAVAYLSSEFVEVEEFVNAIKAKQAQLSEEHSADQDSLRAEAAKTASINDADEIPQQTSSIEPESIEPELIEPGSKKPESVATSVATEEVVVAPKVEAATKPVEPQPVIEQQAESIVADSTVAESTAPETAELKTAELKTAELKTAEPEIAEPEPVATSVATQEMAIERNTEVASEPVEPQIIEPQANISDSQNKKQVVQNTAAIVAPKDEFKRVNVPALAAGSDAATVNKTQSVFDETGKIDAMAVTHSNTEETFVSAEVEKQLSNVDEHGEVIDASQPGGAVREKWITARKSYYQRDYELSEQSYQQVIDSTKNNYDAYGELGNVYFNQGKNEQAASAYFEAAAILVNKGRVNQARSLMGLLRSLDSSKAKELQQLIDSAKS